MANDIKPIVLTDNDTGKVYTLEFSCDSVRFAERHGFSLSDVERYPMTKVPELFFYAFRMHHKDVARNKTDEILNEKLGGITQAMYERLIALYDAPFGAFLVEDDAANPTKMTVEL